MDTIKYLVKQWWFWVVVFAIIIIVAMKKNKDKKIYQNQETWLKGVKNQMDTDLKNLVESEGSLEVWYQPPGTVEQVDTLESLVKTEETGGWTQLLVETPEDIDSLTPLERAVLYTAYLDLDKPGYRWVRNIAGAAYVRGETFDQDLIRSLNYWASNKGLWYKA